MFALAGLALLASAIVPSGGASPQGEAGLWVVRPEDCVHPARRAAVRARATAARSRWVALDEAGTARYRALTRAELFEELGRNGFRRTAKREWSR